jgi:2-polyprenyl-6-methoxyphenol hydroxylase-like FAD-dependent oxidoreductase/Zn-finger nucleic acid-binding protein
MKCIRPSSFRLLPYLIFQASTTFLKSSALLATNGIIANKACHLCKHIPPGDTTRRNMSISAHTEDAMIGNAISDSILSTTSNLLSSSQSTGASIALCPKCRGEGKLSKAPSKKSRLRQQRRIYKQDQEQHNEQEKIQHDNHKRIKRSPSTTSSSGTTPVGTSTTANNPEPKMPILPRRWDPCPKCDQTGLLIPVNISSSESSSSAVTVTHHRPFVAIVGGGIGGIALAVALKHRGIPFMVYEKDSRFDQRRQGYGLTLQQARRALQALGIFENNDDDDRNGSSKSAKFLHEHAVTSTKHVVHTPDGKQVGEWGLRRWVGDANGAKNSGNNSGENCSNSDRQIDNTKMTDIDTKSSKDSSKKVIAATSTRTKLRSTCTKNKKRRQNLHVPRQTLRYALLEALKEASGTDSEEAVAISKISEVDTDDKGSTKATNTKKMSGNDHANINISWGHKLVGMQQVTNGSSTNDVQLSFEVVDEHGNDKRIVTSQANLVVGCDGIRSSVREQLLRPNIGSNDEFNKMEDSKRPDASTTALRYLNCVVILGICPLGDLFPQEAECQSREQLVQQQKKKQTELSPLLDGETVFQTADGTTRIYLMPYSKKNNEYMWQLSFPVPEEETAIALSRRGPKALKEEALKRCQSWHVPIPDILNATPIELVSGYPVYDRDILTSDTLSASRRDTSTTIDAFGDGNQQYVANNYISSPTHSFDAFGSLPITLLGDAAHPMSPFKGQGANQALLDALSLARALYRIHCREGQSLGEAVEHFENEMLDRSSEKVRASSAAARFLHTDVAIQEGDVTRGAAFNSINESEV